MPGIKYAYLIIILSLVFGCQTAYFPEPDRFKEASMLAKTGNIDISFLMFREYLQDYPNTEHTKDIRFAFAEYYLAQKNYRQAIPEFKGFLKDFSEDDLAIFAQLLLYKSLSEYTEGKNLKEDFEKELFSSPVFLVFSESKTLTYKSLLNNTYDIVYYIDNVKIFKNGKLFLEVKR